MSMHLTSFLCVVQASGACTVGPGRSYAPSTATHAGSCHSLLLRWGAEQVPALFCVLPCYLTDPCLLPAVAVCASLTTTARGWGTALVLGTMLGSSCRCSTPCCPDTLPAQQLS